ncbi:MAG TPA: LarC family nickel insertion protein [Thermoleophilia bacterium]|nr:LarC family nickel insertion protein [Thermoleophilia bacterium]
MILYLDCSNGISGDMLVAALLGVAGATADEAGPLDQVVRPALKAAGIDKRLVSLRGVRRGEIDALAFRVPEGPGFATFDELIMSMYASKLDQAVADGVAKLALRMAAAESEVHGVDVAHLHELSGIDTAVDLISAVTLLHHLRPERVVASPVALGNGTVDTAHGVLPVPAPAVAVLAQGLPTTGLPDDGVTLGELTTPTGAALLAEFADEFGPAPAGEVAAVGYGAGTREVPGRLNVLRALLIEPAPEREDTMDEQRESTGGRDDRNGAARRTASGVAGGVRRERTPEDAEPQGRDAEVEPQGRDAQVEPAAAGPWPEPQVREAAAEPAATAGRSEAETPAAASAAETPAADGPVALDHVLLETNIDDMSAELLAHAADALREAGAVDVWMSPATMKKGRPGVVLHVLCDDADRRRLADVLFGETSTFGVRVLPVGRIYAEERRESVTIGKLKVAVRLGFVGGRLVTVSPEYEDVRRVAAAVGRPAKVVYEAAQAAARARFSAP